MVPESFDAFIGNARLYGLLKYPSPLQKVGDSDSYFFLKRDDLLDLGCSKQRSIPFMIDQYISQGARKFAISSSGNAALVSAFCALQNNSVEELKILLSGHESFHISDEKIQKFISLLHLPVSIEDFRKGFIYKNIHFQLVDNPKQKAFQLGNDGYINLRGSTDDSSLWGFASLAFEIDAQCPQCDALFIPASSGTTVAGIYEGFKSMGKSIPIHVVQTTKTNALINKITQRTDIELDHPAQSIVDIVGHRRSEIETIINETKGAGWIINKQQVLQAKSIISSYGVQLSYDSSLTYAAFMQTKTFKNPVLVCTG